MHKFAMPISETMPPTRIDVKTPTLLDPAELDLGFHPEKVRLPVHGR
jgi:hypothetical protein